MLPLPLCNVSVHPPRNLTVVTAKKSLKPLGKLGVILRYILDIFTGEYDEKIYVGIVVSNGEYEVCCWGE